MPPSGRCTDFGENCGVSPEHLRRRYPRKGEIPFDSDRKRMTTVHEQVKNWEFLG